MLRNSLFSRATGVPSRSYRVRGTAIESVDLSGCNVRLVAMILGVLSTECRIPYLR